MRTFVIPFIRWLEVPSLAARVHAAAQRGFLHGGETETRRFGNSRIPILNQRLRDALNQAVPELDVNRVILQHVEILGRSSAVNICEERHG